MGRLVTPNLQLLPDLNLFDRIKFTIFNISRLERNGLLIIGVLIVAIISIVLYYVISNYVFDNRNKEPAVNERAWYISPEDWFARSPDFNSISSNEKFRPLKLVIIAHSVSKVCNSFVECAGSMRYLQDHAMLNKKYGDISYNFAVGGDGRVYEGRGWLYQGAHSLGYNNISIGIAFIGDYTSTLYPNLSLTPGQIANTQKLLQVGVEKGYLSPDYVIKPHCEVRENMRSSPGDIVYREIVKWPHYSNINSTRKCKWALN